MRFILAILMLFSTAPAVAATTFAWNPDSTDGNSCASYCSTSDFDVATQTFTPLSGANQLSFGGPGYFHNHGWGAAQLAIEVLLNGNWQNVYTSAFSGNSGDVALSSLGPISFAGGSVSGIRISSTNYVGNAFHGFGSGNQFTLNAISAVPEPSTWAMMLVGFGGVGFAMRRAKKTEAKLAIA